MEDTHQGKLCRYPLLNIPKTISIDPTYFHTSCMGKLVILLEQPILLLGKISTVDLKEFRRYKKMKKNSTR